MAGEKHLRLSIFGDYVGATEDQPEIWNCNLRMALVFGAVDDVGTFPSDWTVVNDTHGGVETSWDTESTYRIDGPGITTFDPVSYLNDYVGDTLQGFIGNSLTRSSVRVLGAKLYPCDTTGKSIDFNVASLLYSISAVGGGSENMLPPEVSCCFSWETAQRGPRGRGRIYPPPLTVAANDAYGMLTTAAQSTLRTVATTLIEGLSYTSVVAGVPSLRVVVTGPSSSHGAAPYTRYAVINGVRIGRVFDAQRRRRNKLDEAYLSGVIAQA